MYSTLRKFTQAGFTLVELLIVVVILAILAAIVIPQFSSSTTDAREAALDSNLGTLRSAIELFHAQHGFYPAARDAAKGSTCATSGGASTSTVGLSQALIDHLTLFSDKDGATCDATSPALRFGPYIRRSFPVNTVTSIGADKTEIALQTTGAPIVGVIAGTPAATAGGWAYDNKSGQLVANSITPDSGGIKTYIQH
jgi:general secretion pathway protein G